MEVFSGDLNSMEQDIRYCLEAIPRYNNGKNAYNLYRSLQTLLCFYEEVTGEARKYRKKLLKNNSFYHIQDKKYQQFYTERIESFISSKDINMLFSAALFSNDKEFFFKTEIPTTEELHFEEKEIYEIMTDYLKKHTESGILLFDEMIKEKRIYWAPCNEDVRGYTIANDYMKRDHILLMEKTNSTRLLSALAHELGHVCDDYNAYNQPANISGRYLSVSPFIETIAVLNEKRFIEFLIEEGVDKKRTLNILTDLYKNMFDNLSKTTALSSLPDNLLRHEKYIRLPKATFYGRMENLIIDPSDDYLEEPYEYSVIDNPRYAYGTAIAIYLDAIRKADKFRYQEKLSKFMSLRTGYLSSDFFDKLGVSMYEMADIVTDEIEATNKNVLIKK